MTWRWPWVSRARLDAAEAYATACERNAQHLSESVTRADYNAAQWERIWWDLKAIHEGACERAERRYADLMASYRMLKLQGASEPAPTPAPREKPQPDIVKAAISRKCGRNKELRRHMEAQVEADRAAGVSDPEIALRIEQGVTDVVL